MQQQPRRARVMRSVTTSPTTASPATKNAEDWRQPLLRKLANANIDHAIKRDLNRRLTKASLDMPEQSRQRLYDMFDAVLEGAYPSFVSYANHYRIKPRPFFDAFTEVEFGVKIGLELEQHILDALNKHIKQMYEDVRQKRRVTVFQGTCSQAQDLVQSIQQIESNGWNRSVIKMSVPVWQHVKITAALIMLAEWYTTRLPTRLAARRLREGQISPQEALHHTKKAGNFRELRVMQREYRFTQNY